MHDSRLRMASLWPLGLKVVVRLVHLWLSLVTFMVVQVITFMGKFYYICGWWIYYICGLKFLHLWLVLHLLSILLHLWLVLHLWFLLLLQTLHATSCHTSMTLTHEIILSETLLGKTT